VVVAHSGAGPLGAHERRADILGLTLRLDDGGDSLRLIDPLGVEQDHLAWEDFEVGFSAKATQGRSLQRWDTGDHDDGQDWFAAPPSPGVA